MPNEFVLMYEDKDFDNSLVSLTDCGFLAQALAMAVEVRFPMVFSYTTESHVFAAAAACHPKFKLRWVSDNPKEFVKEAFLS